MNLLIIASKFQSSNTISNFNIYLACFAISTSSLSLRSDETDNERSLSDCIRCVVRSYLRL